MLAVAVGVGETGLLGVPVGVPLGELLGRGVAGINGTGKAFAVKSDPRTTLIAGPLLGAGTTTTVALKYCCSQATIAALVPPEPSRIWVCATRGALGPWVAFQPMFCSKPVITFAGVPAYGNQ
jgi:hypothetical protein